MKGIVDFRYFFDDEIFGEKEIPMVEVDLHGQYVKTVSDDTIRRYGAEMNDKIVDTKRLDDGIYVEAKDKDDGKPYNYMWGEYGFYYPYGDTITYVKSERMMKHLYKKFGEEYRDSYIEFCLDIVNQMRNYYIERNIRRAGGKLDRKSLESHAERISIGKMKKIDEEFNAITGRNPDKNGKAKTEKPTEFGE